MKIELKKLSDLKPAPYNPRQSNAEQEKQLKSSLEKFGVVEPIIFNKQTGFIVGGHFRIRELKKLGYKEIECVIVDLNESDEKELNIRLNANTGSWDWDELANNWDSELLSDWGLEIPGFEPTILEAEEDDFTAPDGGTETDIVLGDLFEIGEHRLLCGDSTDSDAVAKLMNGEKADMVFTDPPFPNNSEIMHDMIKNIDGAFNNSRLFCDNLMIWFWDNLEFPPFLEQVTSKHIWHKTNGWQAGHFETMYCYHNDKTRHEQKVFSVNNVGGENNRKEQGNHPTPKPITLVFQIINGIAKKSNTILDLFLGSGTTMVAAHQLKRKCYGMELDPKYCQVIVDRMRKLDPTIKIKRNGIEIK